MIMWNHRNSERPRETPSALENFRAAVAKATSDAESAGVLAVEIHRYLDSISCGYHHKALLRAKALGGVR
jgi:hypothetical protein